MSTPIINIHPCTSHEATRAPLPHAARGLSLLFPQGEHTGTVGVKENSHAREFSFPFLPVFILSSIGCICRLGFTHVKMNP